MGANLLIIGPSAEQPIGTKLRPWDCLSPFTPQRGTVALGQMPAVLESAIYHEA